jgi:hypothetical protein
MSITLWGHGNCAQIPRLSNYAEAKDWYEKVIPIRGRSTVDKPLGRKRRFTQYEICKSTVAIQSENREYDIYSCAMYGKDMVQFFPNGEIAIYNNRWYSITTGAFLNSVLWDTGSIVSESGKWYFENKFSQRFRFKDGMRIRKGDDGVFVPTEVVEDKVFRIDRKRMNAIRKRYSSIVQYGRTMLAIDDNVGKLEELELAKNGLSTSRMVPYYSWQSEETRTSREKWFALADKQMESGDLELLYDLVKCVASVSGQYSYKANGYVGDPVSFTNYMDEMLKYQFRDEIFKAEAVPYGESCADRNKKYFAV